jgi:hypothetical protein
MVEERAKTNRAPRSTGQETDTAAARAHADGPMRITGLWPCGPGGQFYVLTVTITVYSTRIGTHLVTLVTGTKRVRADNNKRY